jgi:hypothetical protein
MLKNEIERQLFELGFVRRVKHSIYPSGPSGNLYDDCLGFLPHLRAISSLIRGGKHRPTLLSELWWDFDSKQVAVIQCQVCKALKEVALVPAVLIIAFLRCSGETRPPQDKTYSNPIIQGLHVGGNIYRYGHAK